MARQESDREDLMKEAIALVRRAEFRIAGIADTCVAGFRSNNAFSIYFGPDPTFHFDQTGRLRRAFVEDRIYRTQGNTLARLIRVHTSQQTELQRFDLPAGELADFLDQTQRRLQTLHAALLRRDVTIIAQIPSENDFLPQLAATLQTILAGPLELAPAIKGKR